MRNLSFPKHKSLSVFEEIQQPLRNESGFTLTEIMVSVGIFGIVLFFVMSQLVHSTQDNIAAVDRDAAETSLVTAELYLRDFLAQSVDVHYTVNNLNARMNAGGQLREYDSSGAPAEATTLALFNREVGSIEDPLPSNERHSVFAPYGMFFIPPTAPTGGNPSTTGVLFFNTVNAANLIQADYSGQFIPDIVEFAIRNPQTYSGPIADGSILSTVDVRIVIRYFEPGKNPKLWCPNPAPLYNAFASSACAGRPSRAFHDIEKLITLKFRNNANQATGLLGDVPLTRMFGSLYFFPVHSSNF